MNLWQLSIVSLYGIIAFVSFVTGFRACYYRNKAYEETPIYGLLYTAFVRADTVIFGLFWALACLITIILSDFLLFLLVLSLFWLVRSIGETLYWFFQQFTPRPGNDPAKFKLHYKIFKNDSVWFVHQIYWQCFTVITTITTIYIANAWLKSLS